MTDVLKPAEAPPTTTDPLVEQKPTETEKSEEVPPVSQPVETAESIEPAVKSETAAVEAPPATPTQTTEPAIANTEIKDPPKTIDPVLENTQWGPIGHDLAAFYTKLPEILELVGYNEIFGVTLEYTNPPAFSTLIILQKFLRANSNILENAVNQLRKTLNWRKEFKPLDALEATHSEDKFAGLGYVQVTKDKDGNQEIITWNIYGSVKDFKKTFGEIDVFLRWRVALMESSISKLNLSSSTKPIPDFGKGPDPYQIAQVHDYLNVSFLRMDPYAKAASKQTIELFRDFYPEMLSRKFFVNVPIVMGWVFNAMKLFLPKVTTAKFQVLSYGSELAKDLGETIPQVYGGKEGTLEELATPVKLGSA